MNLENSNPKDDTGAQRRREGNGNHKYRVDASGRVITEAEHAETIKKKLDDPHRLEH